MIDELAPQPGDIVVVKRRVNAFYNTDLELILRALGASTLLFTGDFHRPRGGIDGAQASDRGFRNIVIADDCASSTPQRHAAALESIADFFGEVKSADDAIKSVG